VGTWLRLVLAILLGLSAAVCFAFRNPVAGAIAAAMATVVVIWVVLGRKQPVLKVTRTEITLAIADAEGRETSVAKVQEITPVGKPLVDIRDRSLFTKGRVDDIEVLPGVVAERMALGKYNIAKVVFEPPLEAGKTTTRRVTYKIYDGFIEDDVSLMFVGDYPTDRLSLRVDFPAARRPRRIRAFVREGKKPDRPADATLSPDGGHATWTVADVKVGVQYHFEWTW